jgi:peptidyl-prolyl cis-trans isomerase-like 4
VYLDSDNRPLTNIRILHTLIIEDPYPDPPHLNIPNSPERIMASDRLEYEEPVLPERQVEEVIKETKKLQAKTWSNMLEMIQVLQYISGQGSIFNNISFIYSLKDIPDADMKLPENILFVCKLNPCTTESDLELIFGRFGSIRSCEVVRDWKSGDSLGYSFIEFETDKACEEG